MEVYKKANKRNRNRVEIWRSFVGLSFGRGKRENGVKVQGLKVQIDRYKKAGGC